VNDTTGEVEVSLGDIGLSAEATVEADSIVLGHDLDTLSTSDIGICRVGQVCRDKGSSVHVGDVAGIVGAVQDMVRQKVGDIAGVVVDHARNGGILEEFLEGIVAWGQDGDISKTAKVSKKTGLSEDKSTKRGESRVLRSNSLGKVGTALGSSEAREGKSDKSLQLHFS